MAAHRSRDIEKIHSSTIQRIPNEFPVETREEIGENQLQNLKEIIREGQRRGAGYTETLTLEEAPTLGYLKELHEKPQGMRGGLKE